MDLDLASILPEIDSFSPWELNPVQLDAYISQKTQELESLFSSDRDLKIDLCMSLNDRINRRRMYIWTIKMEEIMQLNRKNDD